MRAWFCLAAAALLAGSGWAAGPEAEDEDAVAVPDGKPALVLDAGGHTATIRKVFFTADGKQVVTLSADHTVRVTDALTGQAVKVLYPPGFGGLRVGALSPDGRLLATAARYLQGDKVLHVVYLLDLAEGRLERALQGHTDVILALAFSADGKRLASSSRDGATRVWNLNDGRVERVIKKGQRYGLAFSPDGSRLARVSGTFGEIIDLATGKETARIAGDRVAWSPDGKTLATSHHAEGVRLYEPDGTLRLHLLEKAPVFSVAFSADSRCVLVTGSVKPKGYLGILVDVATGRHLAELGAREQQGINDGVLSPDGELAATSGTTSGFHQVLVWKMADGTLAGRLAAQPWITTLTSGRAGWSADGKSVTARLEPKNPRASRSFHLGELQIGPGLAEKDFRGPIQREGALSLEYDSAVTTRVLKDGEKIAVLKDAYWTRATLLGKDRAAAAAHDPSATGAIVLYEAATGKEIRRLRGHSDNVSAPAPSPDGGRYLLTASLDQTLRVWDPGREKPLLSLYMRGSEWVAWTPEGYYAASAGGERLMGWKIDNGIDKMPAFYPASRFHASLSRPDVLGRLLSEGSLKKALEVADRARGQETLAVEVAEVLPPQATLSAPGLEDGKVTEAKLEVEATARGVGKHPVTSLQLLLDGRPYQGGEGLKRIEGAKAGAEVKEKWTVEIPEGEHTLRVLARSEASTGLSNDLAVAFARPAPRPRLFVLAVGINQYQAPGLRLNFAVNDAAELEKTFRAQSKALFEVESRLLTDAKATRRAILEEGFGWLKKNMKPQDLAVVFYAGHGEQDGKSFFLLPHDVDPAKLKKTAISGEELKRRLADLPGKVLLLLDACHSGAIGRAVSDIARDLADEDCGVIVLCAALGSEKAGEDPVVRHGYFCKAILEALRGAPEVQRNRRDGCVYQHHLEQYVIDRVQELSKDEQHPTGARPTIRPFALAKP